MCVHEDVHTERTRFFHQPTTIAHSINLHGHRLFLHNFSPKEFLNVPQRQMFAVCVSDTQTTRINCSGIKYVVNVVLFPTDAQMMQCVIDLFSAGMETTKTTLQWAFLYMAVYPEIQGRVQEEIDSVVGYDRRPTMDDFADLPYTEATICEILRKSCVLPLGNPHAASEDTYFNGFMIPKGATIIPNFWAVHNDEK